MESDSVMFGGDTESAPSQIDMSPVSMDIEFADITLEVNTGLIKKKKKTILKNLSGLFKSGQLTAIMGPSGAGKSSLLNALTGFSTDGVKGNIRTGNSVCHLENKNELTQFLKAYRSKTCYILQDDRLNPLFTVEELMHFAADLKLGNKTTQELKNDVIFKVLNTLSLIGTEKTRCRNLSGGQRKRLSIAVELIDNPPVIFLDEPTTGLDSLSSTQCVKMLKDLATAGRTIVCTIHQPSATIYRMFDQVYILADGMCVYNGSSLNTVPHLAAIGFKCPKYHNPADYVLELANGEYGELNMYLASKCRQHTFNDTLALNGAANEYCRNKKIFSKDHCRPSLLYQFWVLLKRCIIQQYRDWTVTQLKLLLHFLVGLLLGMLYQQSGQDASKSFSNLSFLLVSIAYLCYTSAMPAVLRFPQELPVLKKENFNNWYKLNTYYAAVLVSSIPLQILYSAVYSAPSYVLSGQPTELSRFLMFVVVLACMTLVADALGNIIGTCVNPINGTFFGAISLCVMIVYAGFLVINSDMMPVMRIVSHISFMKYGFEALALAVYANGRATLVCPDTTIYCHLSSPKEILRLFDFKPDNYWVDIGILIALIVVMRIIAFYTLRRRIKRSE